jgi:predicted small metal-binding protein
MTKSISCKDAGKDCTWSATHESEEALMSMVKEHVLAEHKEIELNPENIANIKSLIKEAAPPQKRVRPKMRSGRLGFKKSGLM